MQRAASRSRFMASIRVSGDGIADHLVWIDYFSDGSNLAIERPGLHRSFHRATRVLTVTDPAGTSEDVVEGALHLPPEMMLVTPGLVLRGDVEQGALYPVGVDLDCARLDVRLGSRDDEGSEYLVGGVSFDVERAVGTSMRLHDQYFEVESFSAELFG